ncbi:MAG: TIGR02206 family membrane protein, partial [Acidimicrobiales bacterium]
AVSFVVALIVEGNFSPRTSLPLALCDMAALVAAAACWTRLALLVEITYFWGLAGTLQAVITPDLNAGFPHLVFFQYMVGHLGIVVAALFLVVGLGVAPRRGAVVRVFTITLLYTAVVGAVDAAGGANYMFLRSPPGEWTLLRVLGPWPWYIASAAGVALVLLVALDAPFWHLR